MSIKNEYFVRDEVVYIKIIKRNGNVVYTKIDFCDLELINKFNFRIGVAYSNGTKSYYAGNKKYGYLHRILLNPKQNKVIDHINHDTLDNRRVNLRIVNKSENQFNQKNPKGCYFNKQCKKWLAYITFYKKRIWLGSFNSEEKAHEEYLKAKNKYHEIGGK